MSFPEPAERIDLTAAVARLASGAPPLETALEEGADLIFRHPRWVESLASSLRRLPIATILLILITLVAAVAGAIVVVTNPQTLTFAAYLADLKVLAIGLGLLGVGRGIAGQR